MCVCDCCKHKHTDEDRRRDVTGEKTDTFLKSSLGRRETLAKFFGLTTVERALNGEGRTSASLCCREENLRNASRYGERPLNRGWKAGNSRLFFQKWNVVEDTPTTKGECVCVWASAAEARKAEGSAPCAYG